MCPILIGGGWTLKQIIFLSPLIFGSAHLHHFLPHFFTKPPPPQQQQTPNSPQSQIRNTNQELKRLALQSLFQGAYTTVFGWYAAFLFIRTGHTVAAFIAHATCNYLGFPQLDLAWGEGAQYPQLKGVFLGGLLAFCVLLFPLTSPEYFESVYWTLQ
jgi:prenyl protein peptidase